jgi:hypothetical protein
MKQGAEAIAKWRKDKLYPKLDLRGAKLSEANLLTADLSGADLSYADLSQADLSHADLSQADLSHADLSHADLSRARLSYADLSEANLAGAMLFETNLVRTRLGQVKGAHNIRRLETAHISGGDPRYFELCIRSWPERWFDWERLRTVGSLPLFGISYTALILIPIVFYGLAVYNEQIDQVHTWAERVAAPPDSLLYQLVSLFKRFHHRPIPSLSLMLLVSTLLLAVGSTLYTFFCPSRIKEFSRDEWCDQIGRSLLHYWPLAWKYRYVRLVCAACYALGGAGAAWVIAHKVWHTAVFILQHSTWSWPWR